MSELSVKKRIDYIDLAKGICILLVISIHLDRYHLVYFNDRINDAFFSFRMPLYFIISGLFLRLGGIHDFRFFLEKKINRLLIPLVFFTTLTNIYNYVCYHLHLHANFKLCSTFLMAMDESYSGGVIGWNNGPIFFVFWLFECYMIMAILNLMFNGNIVKMWFTVMTISFIGYNCQLPATIDTAMTCTPFVLIGLTIRKKTNLLTCELTKKQSFILPFIALMLIGILIVIHPGRNLFYDNRYGTSWIEVYLYGIIGTLAILMIAKSIVRIPFVSYIGRYSIVILGVHQIILEDTYRLFNKLGFSNVMCEISVFVVVLALSTLAIPLFIKYVPKFCAQQDLLKINW